MTITQKIARLEKLAKVVETKETIRGLQFDMRAVIKIPSMGFLAALYSADIARKFECGSAGCLVAWTCIEFGKTGGMIDFWTAMKHLDLTEKEAVELFTPSHNQTLYPNRRGGAEMSIEYWKRLTRADAAMALRRLAKRMQKSASAAIRKTEKSL